MAQANVGNALGLIGLLLAVYFYLKQKTAKRVRYIREDVTIAGDGSTDVAGDLKIIYKGVEVKRVTQTNIALWNASNVALSVSDFANTDPLRIESRDGSIILKSTITQYIDVRSDYKISQVGQAAVNILFDYMEPRSGVMIEIVHNGDDESLDILGKIVGGEERPRRGNNEPFLGSLLNSSHPMKVVGFALLFVLPLVFAGFAFGLLFAAYKALILLYYYLMGSVVSASLEADISFVLIVVALIVGYAGYWGNVWRDYTINGIPVRGWEQGSGGVERSATMMPVAPPRATRRRGIASSESTKGAAGRE